MNKQNTTRESSGNGIGKLIRLAKQDSKVPEERAARVRAAAREQWTKQTEQRRRRRVFWSVAAAAAMIAGIAFVIRSIPGTGTVGPLAFAAQVEQLEGHVETATLESNAWRTLSNGDSIDAATAVRTVAGRLSLRLDSGHCARVDQNSEVRFLERGGLELAAGRIYVDSGQDGRQSSVELHTPYGIVQEIGTQYEVQLNDGLLLLRLREGSAILHHANGDVTVNAGQELRVSATQDPEIAAIERYGPQWDWVSEIVSIPDFQGKTADEFLRWLAREKGWTLDYADGRVANAARNTVIEGDLGRFTPDEALQIVSTTSRLSLTAEAGVLRVSLLD
jgi:hypothetical protein